MRAFTLNRQPLRSDDQTITFYTAEEGKVSAVAKGVKKIISKNSSALEPLALIDVEIIPGKGVRYVGAVSIDQSYSGIRRSLAPLLAANSAIVILNTIIVGQEKDERIFKLIGDFFIFLNSSEPTENSLDHFVAELLGYLGFSLPNTPLSHPALLEHARFYTGLAIADWNNYKSFLI